MSQIPQAQSPGTQSLNPFEITAANGDDREPQEPEVSAKTSVDAEPMPRCRFSFVDFSVEAITGLRYKLCFDGCEISGITDDNGQSELLTGLAPNTRVDVYVYREHRNNYKKIGSVFSASDEVEFTLVSPKLKLEATTELHQGAATTEETPRLGTATLPSASGEIGATKKDSPTQSTPSPTTILHRHPKITTGRNPEGHPQGKVNATSADAAGRNLLPSLNFWTWRDFVHTPALKAVDNLSKQSPAGSGKRRPVRGEKKTPMLTVTGGHHAVNAPVPAATGTQLSDREHKLLSELLEFAERQTALDYTQLKGVKGGPTVALLKKYSVEKSPVFPAKDTAKSLGMCLAYVKVALRKCGYINGIFGTGDAKESGEGWLKFGFADQIKLESFNEAIGIARLAS